MHELEGIAGTTAGRPATGGTPSGACGADQEVGTCHTALVRLIQARGPLTGAEIHEALGGESFVHWKTTRLAEDLAVRRVGTRYLRLDQRVEGYARLSPSILREFLTYSVVGLADDPESLEARAQQIAEHAREVTRAKLELARGIVTASVEGLGHGPSIRDSLCVLIAGDIVYDMAHDVPRPERSTGRLVRGSDLDIVVVVDDNAPGELVEELDEAIYRQKYRTLINPAVREEVDYIVKPLRRLREQTEFDTFKKMVACKILHEGMLLYGSSRLFEAAKRLLLEYGVVERLEAMEAAAVKARAEAEAVLLASGRQALEGDEQYLFYTAEESDEFE